MRYLFGITGLTLLIISCAGYGAAHAAAGSASSPVLFANIAGTWSCTAHGPKGTRTSTTTWTRLADGWFQGVGKHSAVGNMPAGTSASLLGYDSKNQEYVSMGGSSTAGDWGVGVAKASPSASTFTFDGAYPPDPTHEKSTYRVSANRLNLDDDLDRKREDDDTQRRLQQDLTSLWKIPARDATIASWVRNRSMEAVECVN